VGLWRLAIAYAVMRRSSSGVSGDVDYV